MQMFPFEYRKLGDFTYHVLDDPKEIKAYLKYDSSIVSEQQISWLFRNLTNLIEIIIKNKSNWCFIITYQPQDVLEAIHNYKQYDSKQHRLN